MRIILPTETIEPIFGASVLLLAGLEKLFARLRPLPPQESTST